MEMIVVGEWCDRGLYLSSLFAGKAGTNNELNVLVVSPLIQSILQGDFKFEVRYELTLADNGPT